MKLVMNFFSTDSRDPLGFTRGTAVCETAVPRQILSDPYKTRFAQTAVFKSPTVLRNVFF